MDNYNIISILGYGMQGIILLVEKNNEQYAMKISFEFNIEKAKYNLNNEIKFQKSVVEECPDCFIKLYDYSLIDNCTISKNIKNLIENEKDKIPKKLIDKINKPYICIKKIYNLVDGNLHQIIQNLNKKQIFSAIIQIANCIHILEKNNYVHLDIRNNKNIAYTETNNEFVQIKKKNIPTFGFYWKIIDYDKLKKINEKYNSEDFMYEFLYAFIFSFLFGNINIKSTEFYDKNHVSVRRIGTQKFNNDNENKYVKKIKKLNIPSMIGNALFMYYYPKKYGRWLLKDNDQNLYKDYKKIYLSENIKMKNLENLNITFKKMKKIIKHKNNTQKLIKIFMKEIENT
jgi:hypothetical protein